MREIIVSEEFISQLDNLEKEMQRRVYKTIELLSEHGPAYPSLKSHPVERAAGGGKWECYVTMSHRIIFETEGDIIKLWKVGDHSVVDKVHTLSFSPHTIFRRLDEEQPEEEAVEEFVIPDEWYQVQQDRPADNPFIHLAISHLRILGVPASLVKAVRTVPHIEEIERIQGLPEQTVSWLYELATNPDLENVLFDPGRLIFRTTLDRLEGYIEGSIKSLMLNLSDEQKQFVDKDYGTTTLLRGCAGSGKTTIAIYRAIRLAETGARVIFITYNRTLAKVAEKLFVELIGPLPDNLVVANFDSSIVNFLRDRGHTINILDNDEQRNLVQSAIETVRRDSSSYILSESWAFFRDEISQVIKGNGFTREEQYLEIARYGRKEPLKLGARKIVWRIYEAYQHQLSARGLLDWQDVALHAYRELFAAPLDTPYDHVLIDEAQDLSPMQLRVAQRLNKGGAAEFTRSTFLVGDVAQSIYSRGYTWSQAGLNVRGNSYSIQRNFRNTLQIATAASVLNANNKFITMSEDYVDPKFTHRQGPQPIAIVSDVTDREVRAVSEKLLNLIEGQQFRLSDFAIICPTIDLVAAYGEELNRQNIPTSIYNEDNFDILEERVKILTIHSAKGLEFPVVFLVGLHNGILPKRYWKADDEEEIIQVERDRTLMYVGMTRAAEALFLITSREAQSLFMKEIEQLIKFETFTGGK